MLNYTFYYNHPTFGYLAFASFKWAIDSRLFWESGIFGIDKDTVFISFDSGKTYILANEYFTTLEG